MNSTVFSKVLTIKTADLVIFPQNVEFLSISTIFEAPPPEKALNSLKSKENPNKINNALHKKNSNTIKIQAEIENFEKSIEKKREILLKSEKNEENNEKEAKKAQELKDLIAKWRKIAQESLIDLQKQLKSRESSSNNDISLHFLMKTLNLNPEILNYDVENDDFF